MSKFRIYVWKGKEREYIAVGRPGMSVGLQPRNDPTALDLYKQLLDAVNDPRAKSGYEIIIGMPPDDFITRLNV